MTPHPSNDGREPLTREKIIDKALELLDAEGAEGLSMRRLGQALGIEAMSLYHHFPNKDAILDALLARIVEETGPAAPLRGEDWKSVMLSGPAAAGRALEAHPKAGWLFLGRQYSTAPSLEMLEAPLAILHSAGFRGQELVDAAHAIFAFTAGWYMLTSGQGGSWSGPDDEAIAAAAQAAPLAASLAPELRDWSRGMDAGLMALMEGLEARRRT
jgi:AcrR family transcriptional regulator